MQRRSAATDAGLPVPRTAAGRAGLAALVANPPRSLIAVDFDGTLAPIVADPAAARATPAAGAALRELALVAGTVAVITGRPAPDAARLAGLAEVPRVVVLGHYGHQRWERGVLDSSPAPPGLALVRADLPGILSSERADPATWVEDKGEAVAVHTRRAADPGAELDRLRAPLTALASRAGLVVEPGRFVLELRAPGADKGAALKRLAAERRPAAIMYCGDDLGDKPAFAAVRELRDRGTPGLVVCSGSVEVPDLAAEADLVLAGPDEVASMLAALAVAFAASAS